MKQAKGLREFIELLNSRAVDEADLAAQDKIAQLGMPPNRIALVTSFTGVTFEKARTSLVETELDGLLVTMLGRGALLKNRRTTGRAKDLADVEAIDPRWSSVS